jgi:hypothetical protein
MRTSGQWTISIDDGQPVTFNGFLVNCRSLQLSSFIILSIVKDPFRINSLQLKFRSSVDRGGCLYLTHIFHRYINKLTIHIKKQIHHAYSSELTVTQFYLHHLLQFPSKDKRDSSLYDLHFQ